MTATHQASKPRGAASLCGTFHPEDGIDPRILKRRRAPRSRRRKTKQVCKQAERILNLALSGESLDPWLGALTVYAVRPAPNSARLLVLVRADAEDGAGLDAYEALQRSRGRLRTAVAHAINRRRAPTLTFQVLPTRMPVA